MAGCCTHSQAVKGCRVKGALARLRRTRDVSSANTCFRPKPPALSTPQHISTQPLRLLRLTWITVALRSACAQSEKTPPATCVWFGFVVAAVGCAARFLCACVRCLPCDQQSISSPRRKKGKNDAVGKHHIHGRTHVCVRVCAHACFNVHTSPSLSLSLPPSFTCEHTRRALTPVAPPPTNTLA